MRGADDLASCCMAAAMALMLYSREKSWAESSSQVATGLACPSKSQSLKKEADLRLIFLWSLTGETTNLSTLLKSGSSHQVDETACCNDIEMLDRSDKHLPGGQEGRGQGGGPPQPWMP